MKHRLIMIFILSIGIFGLTCQKPEPETTGNIQGIVKNSNNQLLNGVSVKINTTPNETTITTSTDGAYSFKQLEPKTYQISVSISGYEPSTQNVTVIAGDTKTLDFTLAQIVPTIATVTTGTISNIAQTSANITGNLTSFGTSYTQVSQYGFCWSTNSVPTINDTKTELGIKNSLGEFTNPINGLIINTKYYIRAFATNATGTAYGETKEFITLQNTPPSVSTGYVSNIGETTATISISILNFGTGSTSLQQYGFCYSTTNQNPTTNDQVKNLGTLTQTGTYSGNLTNLIQEKTYYICAFATNSTGTAYGNVITFKTKLYFSTNLVAFYPFNGNANDESGNGNNGTVYGATISNGKIGESYYFNGSSYISIPNNPLLNFGVGEFSISLWCKVTVNPTVENFAILNKGKILFGSCFGTNGYVIYNSLTSHNIIAGIENASIQNTWGVTNPTATNLNNWYFVTFVRNNSQSKIYLYINGVQVSENPISDNADVSNTEPLEFGVGKYPCDNGSHVSWLLGNIDEVRLYNRVLSLSDIQQLYNATK